MLLNMSTAFMRIRNSVGILFCMLISACHGTLQDADYIKYVEDTDNGFNNEVVVDQWQYNIQYKPYRYVLIKEHLKAGTKEYEARLKQLEHTVLYNISLRRRDTEVDPLKYGVADLEEYNRRLDYFLNYAREDITLEYDGKKIMPNSYLFENNYSLTPKQTMVVGFVLPDDAYPGRDMSLSYNDRVFKTGIIRAALSKQKLVDIK